MKERIIDMSLIINPTIFEKRNIYIYLSSDINERQGILKVVRNLMYYEIYFDGFATDESSYIGMSIFHKKVHNITEIDLKCASILVDINSKYSTVYDPVALVSNNHEKNRCKYIYREDVEGFCLKDNVYLRLYRITEMENLLEGKRIFIYGADNMALRFSRYLNLLDFNFCGFLDDSQNISEEIKSEIGFDIRIIEEYLYEEDSYLILVKSDFERPVAIQKLGNLGLEYIRDYVLAEPFAMHYLFVRKNALDVNLGNTFVGNSKFDGLILKKHCIDSRYPGFVIYGDNKETDFRIITLGGSTTDGHLFPFKSWPELLWEYCAADNITIFNGGCAGYTSAQETIKLIRDALVLNPCMIIVFDGYNDTYLGDKHFPYSFVYSKEVYKFGAKHLENDYVRQQISGEVCEGLLKETSRFDNWINNIEIMEMISRSKGIRFHAFLQPMLTEKTRNKREEEIFMSSVRFFEMDIDEKESFREKANIIDLKYIHNITNLFDNEDDVFMDICHVNENGNRKISECIYSFVKSELPMIGRQRYE